MPRRWPLLAVAIAGAGAAGALALALAALRSGGGEVTELDAVVAGGTLRERRLTAFPPENRVDTLAVAPDGSFFAYRNRSGTWIAPMDGEGPPRAIAIRGLDAVEPIDVFPGGRRLLVRELLEPAGDATVVALGILDLDGGEVSWLRQRPYRFGALRGRLSPDGARIVYYGERGLHVMSASGDDDRLLVPFAEPEGSIVQAWSPDGRHIAFIRDRWTRDGWNTRLEVVSEDGARVTAPPTEGFLNQIGGVQALAWTSSGRLVYGAVDGPRGSALWAMGLVDGEWDGRPQRRLHGWLEAGVDWLWSVGSSLLYVKNSELGTDVLVAELAEDGGLVGAPRRLTAHEGYDALQGWTGDGRVLFASDRHGTWDLFAQEPSSLRAEIVADGPAVETGARAAGDALLFWRIEGLGRDETPRCRLLRREPGREPTELLVLDHVTPPETLPPFCARVQCVSADLCLLVEDVHGDEVVSLFDPRDDVLRRRPTRARRGGALSPDGRTLAAGVAGERTRLALVDLESGRETLVDLDRVLDIAAVRWRPDRPGWLVTSKHRDGWILAEVDPSGATRVLWSRPNTWIADVSLSRDGRRIALTTQAARCDVWRLDGLDL
jgi:Tol biopolymer transport system component